MRSLKRVQKQSWLMLAEFQGMGDQGEEGEGLKGREEKRREGERNLEGLDPHNVSDGLTPMQIYIHRTTLTTCRPKVYSCMPLP